MSTNTTYFFISLILFGFALSSCKMEKRIYRKGFHITWNRTQLHKVSRVNNVDKIGNIKNITAEQLNLTATTNLTLNEIQVEHLETLPILKNETSAIMKTQSKNQLAQPEVTSQIEKESTKKSKKQTMTPKRKSALLIGLSLIAMAFAGGFANFSLLSVFVAGNDIQTAANVAASFSTLIASIAAWVVVILLDLAVSYGVNKHFKNEHPKLAKLSAGLRYLYTAFLMVATSMLFQVNTTSASVEVFSKLTSFFSIWDAGLFIFGLHLITLGLLFNPKNAKPWFTKTMKILLIIAGLAYIIQSAGLLFAANPTTWKTTFESIFMIPMIIGEIGFAIWMAIKGGKEA